MQRLPPGILSFGACVATGGPILPEIYSPTFVEEIEQPAGLLSIPSCWETSVPTGGGKVITGRGRRRL